MGSEFESKNSHTNNKVHGLFNRSAYDQYLKGYILKSPVKWVKRRKKIRVPITLQLASTDCAIACLSMILNYYGRRISLEQLRTVSGISRDGETAFKIKNLAARFGLFCKGLTVEIEELEFVNMPAIIHWRFDHFVVLEQITKKKASIVDPASGRLSISLEELRNNFTGVLLEFESTYLLSNIEKIESSFAPSLSERFKSLFAGSRHFFVKVALISIWLHILSLLLPTTTAFIIDKLVPTKASGWMPVYILGLLAYGAFFFFSNFIRGHILITLQSFVDRRMTLSFFSHLFSLPFSFFQTHSIGDILMRLNSNAFIREIISGQIVSTLVDAPLALFYFCIAIFLNMKLTLLALIFTVIQVSVALLSIRVSNVLLKREIQEQSRSQSYQNEAVQLAELVKVSGANSMILEKWDYLFSAYLNASISRQRASVLFSNLLNAISLLTPMILLGFGASLVISGEISLGSMLAINAILASFGAPVSSIVANLQRLQFIESQLERINDVLRQTPEQTVTDIKDVELNGALTVDKVSFAFSNDESLILNDVSLELKPGTFTAIVGKTGSGKSTLAKLLVGLYSPQKGRILYDDHALNDYDLSAIRQNIGFAIQTPMLFDDTIRNNICFSNPQLAFDEMEWAAAMAEFSNEILSMPMKYDTRIGENGCNLSGGQRQRLCLARALATKPRFLILDEATCELDSLTEKQIFSNIFNLDCTKIVVTHRLHTIRAAHLIIVLNDGKIMEAGTHYSLIKKNGLYKSFCQAAEQR